MNQYPAIEVVKNVDDSTDLLLCGLEELHRTTKIIAQDIYYGVINDSHLFCNFFKDHPNCHFYYKLFTYKDSEIIRHEYGIGSIYSHDGSHYLKRLHPLFKGKTLNTTVSTKSDSKYICTDVTIAIVSSPETINNMVHCPNCLITSKSANIPISIHIDNNSFVGRTDGNLTSISFSDPAMLQNILDSLKSLKLEAKTLSTTGLQLKPNTENVKKGTLIYDEKTDSVKFYNGHKWRTLKWEEDENQE